MDNTLQAEYQAVLNLAGKVAAQRNEGKPVDREDLSLLFKSYIDMRKTIVFKDASALVGTVLSEQMNGLKNSEPGRRRIVEILSGVSGDSRISGEITIVLNPGFLALKVSAFRGTDLIWKEYLPVPPGQPNDLSLRVAQITELLVEKRIQRDEIAGIACRSGVLKPCRGGTYLVGDELLKDVENAIIDHPANLGIPITIELLKEFKRDDITVTTTDPISTDEFKNLSEMTGLQGFKRNSWLPHYLNHRAVAKIACNQLNVDYEKSVIVTAHLGGSISAVRHCNGMIDDIRNAYSELPGSNRSGFIPIEEIMFSMEKGSITAQDLRRWLFTEGGLINLAGTNDFKTLMSFRTNGANEQQREKIELLLDFFAREIASGIAFLCASDAKPEFLVMTGGLANSEEMTTRVMSKLPNLMPTAVLCGNVVNLALAAGNIRARIDPSSVLDYNREKLIHNKRRAEDEKVLAVKVFEKPVYRLKSGSPARSIDDIISLALGMTLQHGIPDVCVVGGDNEEVIDAAHLASAEGRYKMARFSLAGPKIGISRLAWKNDINIENENIKIIDTGDPVKTCMDLYKSKSANLLMKGSITTEKLMHSFIEATKTMLAEGEKVFLSHVAVLGVPSYPKLMILSDAGINPAPNKNAKIKIIKNALTVAAALNIRNPKVAVISAVEKVNPSVQSSVEAREIADELKNETSFICEGPLSMDVATSPKIAAEKKYEGRIQGDADILIMPDIESGNVAYKSLTVSSHAISAGCVMGGKIPLILTSRGDTAQTKMASISMGILLHFLSSGK